MFKKTTESTSMYVGVYKDDVWDEIGDDKKLTCMQKRERATFIKPVNVPFNGEYGDTSTVKYSTLGRPMIWYFVIMDCEHETHSKHRTMPKIQVEINMRNGDGTDHFSYEE
jgi:hypothetical protein